MGNGMPAELSYPWIVVYGGTETDIDGATSSTYSLTGADAGKQIKVRVSFADDAGENQHSHEPGDAGGGGGGRHDHQCDRRREGTGKIDSVHYALWPDGDSASAVTVPVTAEGFAGNDWNLQATRRTHQAKFEVGNATATLSVRMGWASAASASPTGDVERHPHHAARRMAAS